MTCRTETADMHVYTFCPDTAPAAADRMRAVLAARAVDEITQDTLTVDITARTSTPDMTPRCAPFGRIGLVGRPARAFPGLDVNPVELDLRISAPGYIPLNLGGALGPLAGFPGVFTPLDLGDVHLHRIAVGLRGRTLQRGGLQPWVVDGADITLQGWWPVMPEAGMPPMPTMQTPDLAHTEPCLYAPRAIGAMVRRRNLPALPGAGKALLLPAAQGTRRLRLSDRVSLAAGSVLIVDPDDVGRCERMAVTQVDPSSSPDQPAWITLAHPLAFAHPENTRCEVAAPQLPGVANALTRTAIPGDEVLFLDGLSGLVEGSVLEIDDGASPPEFHITRLYRTTSDASGYFRLPPISRVAMVLLRAQRAGLAPPEDMRLAPDYRVSENRITIMFP